MMNLVHELAGPAHSAGLTLFRSPAMSCVYPARPQVVELLLRAGARIDLKNAVGTGYYCKITILPIKQEKKKEGLAKVC